MKKLFMVTIGGKTSVSNIEIHDIRFVLGETIEDTFEFLKATWFGTEKSLHIDSYRIIDHVEGYDITISDKASDTKLFMVNLGGTERPSYLEWHTNVLVACQSKSQAIDLASRQFKNIKDLHIDNIVHINDCLQGQGQVKLITSHKANKIKEFVGYMKIR